MSLITFQFIDTINSVLYNFRIRLALPHCKREKSGG